MYVVAGVSCYANSAITSLFSLPSFVDYLSSCPNNNMAVEPVTAELWRLLTSDGPSELTSLRRLIPGERWMAAEQQDAAEFCLSVITSLQNQADDGGLQLQNLLTLMKETEYVCQTCKNVQMDREGGADSITLLPIKASLSQSFESAMMNPSRPPFRENCLCSTTGPTTFVGQTKITKYPVCWVFQLGRFNDRGEKNNQLIEVPRIWRPAGLEYHLRAAIIHTGGQSISSGHYRALRFESDGQWRMVDDENVYCMNPQDAEVMIKKAAYILYYDMQQGESQIMKRLKSSNNDDPLPLLAVVEQVKGNFAGPAGDDSVPKQPQIGRAHV